jgi:hypothetical protein
MYTYLVDTRISASSKNILGFPSSRVEAGIQARGGFLKCIGCTTTGFNPTTMSYLSSYFRQFGKIFWDFLWYGWRQVFKRERAKEDRS